MSTVNTAVTKRPYKLIEIPLNKFQEEAVPHHQAVFETHKNTVQKFISLNNVQQLDREIKDKKRIVRQLKDLLYELDTLRTQVENCDLSRFDSKTLSLRKIIQELLSKYAALETEATKIMQNDIEQNKIDTNQNPTHGASQLQIQDDLSELKLQDNEQKLKQVEALNKDIEDVHEIFVDLNDMVATQKEHVDMVATNVEVANENVSNGLRHLIQASRLKKATYPVAGAFIGTVIGGPIGSVAGLKIGGLAAIGCGLIGYVSGRFIKKANENQIANEEVDRATTVDSTDCNAVTNASEKKNI